MKLGTETNSLVNHVLSRAVVGQPEPVVGMGVTILHWTDRDAGTITAVDLIGKQIQITVQEDRALRIDQNGMSECQDYRHERNPHGRVSYHRRDPSGVWKEVAFNARTKRWVNLNGRGLRIGERRKYHDFSF
jgi:hypothetical protein